MIILILINLLMIGNSNKIAIFIEYKIKEKQENYYLFI